MPCFICVVVVVLSSKIGITVNPMPNRLKSLNFGASGTIVFISPDYSGFGSFTISKNSTTSFTSRSRMFEFKYTNWLC